MYNCISFKFDMVLCGVIQSAEPIRASQNPLRSTPGLKAVRDHSRFCSVAKSLRYDRNQMSCSYRLTPNGARPLIPALLVSLKIMGIEKIYINKAGLMCLLWKLGGIEIFAACIIAGIAIVTPIVLACFFHIVLRICLRSKKLK